jgi:hypothetical protein
MYRAGRRSLAVDAAGVAEATRARAVTASKTDLRTHIPIYEADAAYIRANRDVLAAPSGKGHSAS